MDGVDLMPHAMGAKEGVVHEYLFWRFGPQHAARKGNWKLSITPKYGTILADLSADPGEKHDLSKDRPEIFAEMKMALDAWEKELPALNWNRPGAGAQTKEEN